MKSKSIFCFSTIALAITSAASAEVVNIDNQALHYGTLLTDNFNTPSYNWWEFNNSIAADQGGTLAALPYTTNTGGDGYTAQHSNGGNMLLTSDGWGGWGATASPNHNFATTANTTNKPLEIQFDLWSTGGDDPDWIGFGLNGGQGQLFYEGVYGFAPRVQDGKHNYKLVISDTAGTGSGFNGITDGAKIEFYKDNVWQETITETLGTSDGYITFRTIPSAWTGWNIGLVDNLKITSGQLTNPLATSSELNLSNNGSLNFGDVTQTVAKLDGTAGTTVKLFNSSLTVNGSDNSSFAGVINGSGGSLIKNGSGTLTLSGANTYSGGTMVSAGTLILDGASGGTSRIAGDLIVNSGATVALTNGDTTGLGYNPGNKVTSLTINGGTVTTAGVTHIWNLSGGVNMTGGTLQSNNGVSDANGSQMEWINSTVTTNASAATATIGGRIRMRADGGAAGITFNIADGDAATDLLVSAAITEASGGRSITKTGAGTMALSGTNTYTGSTTVSDGVLSLSSATLDDIAAVVIGTTGKIDLNFFGSDTVGNLEIDGSGPLPAGVYNSSHPTYGSFFTGTGSLVVAGSNGTWTSLVDGNWSDSANWDSGTIAVGYDATATFNAATGVNVTVDSNRKIGNLAFSTSGYALNGAGVLLLDAGTTPAVSVTSGNIATIASNLGGGIGLEKTGDGTLVFTGMKSYTGGTIVTGGTLELQGATGGNAQIHGSVFIDSGATLAFTGGDGTGFGYFNNPVTSVFVAGGTINAAGSSHLGFGLAATMQLDNGATILGNWQWNGDGLLTFSSSGNATNTISGNIVLRPDAGTNHTFNVDDGTSLTDLVVDANLADLFPAESWGTSGLTKAGTGTMILEGTNTYDGNTVVTGGTLSVSSTGSLRFRPTTNGATNKVSGSGTGALSFLGTVDLDLGAANTTGGNLWNLFNLASFAAAPDLANTAGVTSTLGAFTEVSAGTWELPVTGAKWVFTEGDGNLAYVVTATDYDTWKSANGVTGGENDDDDADGLTNHEEYAFGTDPTGGSSVNPITVPLDKTTGTFSYTRRLQSLTGLTYSVWTSTDLATWTEDTGATTSQTVTGTVGEVETVQATIPGTLPLTAPKLFIQVRAN
ncbi:MAG: autotransporter-associated beta strand repeat-containing protein [Verrucomicrobia bacterium]|nr:autotransporter-associated beta strand repeat-containing protein [Verrucomicrobiota bacterium]